MTSDRNHILLSCTIFGVLSRKHNHRNTRFSQRTDDGCDVEIHIRGTIADFVNSACQIFHVKSVAIFLADRCVEALIVHTEVRIVRLAELENTALGKNRGCDQEQTVQNGNPK